MRLAIRSLIPTRGMRRWWPRWKWHFGNARGVLKTQNEPLTLLLFQNLDLNTLLWFRYPGRSLRASHRPLHMSDCYIWLHESDTHIRNRQSARFKYEGKSGFQFSFDLAPVLPPPTDDIYHFAVFSKEIRVCGGIVLVPSRCLSLLQCSDLRFISILGRGNQGVRNNYHRSENKRNDRSEHNNCPPGHFKIANHCLAYARATAASSRHTHPTDRSASSPSFAHSLPRIQ